MEDYIDKLKDNPAFLQFEEFVLFQIDQLNSVAGLEKMTDKQAGEEAKLRANTKAFLEGLLSQFFNFSEKKEPTQEQIAGAKAKFNL